MSEGPDGCENVTKPESLAELFNRGRALQESSPSDAVSILQDVQEQVARLSLFSRNEELADLSTTSLPFLSLEHHLAMSYINVPTGPDQIAYRKTNLLRACDLWMDFLERLRQLELLTNEDIQQFKDLVEIQSSVTAVEPGQLSSATLSLAGNRDTKISRFKAKQAAENDRQRLESLQQRRYRLGLSETDALDGKDSDSLWRSIHLKSLEISKMEALEEWTSAIRELPMLSMMAQQQQQHDSHYKATATNSERDGGRTRTSRDRPLQVTRISKDHMGQLLVRREDIQSQVFQPHWQQPTMSLDELAEREVAAALERERRQSVTEQAEKDQARRYELLVKDGMEDNHELVDASVALDRRWDDWKEANPRGSGNKRGDVGDRNF